MKISSAHYDRDNPLEWLIDNFKYGGLVVTDDEDRTVMANILLSVREKLIDLDKRADALYEEIDYLHSCNNEDQ